MVFSGALATDFGAGCQSSIPDHGASTSCCKGLLRLVRHSDREGCKRSGQGRVRVISRFFVGVYQFRGGSDVTRPRGLLRDRSGVCELTEQGRVSLTETRLMVTNRSPTLGKNGYQYPSGKDYGASPGREDSKGKDNSSFTNTDRR
jgi:hypothetical protein